MTKSKKITTLFVDIGGVLLTNGWERYCCDLAVKTFHLDGEENNEHHHFTFDTYESGKLSPNDYIKPCLL